MVSGIETRQWTEGTGIKILRQQQEEEDTGTKILREGQGKKEIE